ncbi:chaperone modulator CbpM [Streptomyces ficellus]|uniref:Chaperone modulator CbpM n=1 Tax=Streptomyces ficellus TaxID=1977088 RepID=A0ABT7Z499_9ACTN|nr:chaperone modulator CbpM [Streptomyces ficellus]MDN3294328.1 chaperone modulator CbpM [Streptomyces ficellus]
MAQNPSRYPLARVTATYGAYGTYSAHGTHGTHGTYGMYRAGVPLDEFAAATGLHPELVRRYVTLGLLEPDTDPAGRLWFGTAQLARVARIHRLRTGLGLNYAALGVVLDLLDRIEELEAALARRGSSTGRR